MFLLFLLAPLVAASPQASPQEGLTLFAPSNSTSTYLLDGSQNIAHTWADTARPGQAVYLMENGNLLRTYRHGNFAASNLGGGGGGVHELAWDGTEIWDFTYASDDHLLHHDVEELPNGNILMIAWEDMSYSGALAAGRDPIVTSGSVFWSEMVMEVEPSTGTIVWEWHLWDHIVQDFDAGKPNHGVVADNPQLVDLNFPYSIPRNGDWIHLNTIDYNEQFDQIVLSSRALSEIWIIDHSTTTAEAASHSGGNSGKGGDLLYRWGNPAAYDRGSAADQMLFSQHDIQWIDADLPGGGNLLVFNNGPGRPTGNWSSIDEFTPPVDALGNYSLTPGAAFGPTNLTWTYFGSPLTSFYGDHISGTERMANGNTLICEGTSGRIFEVDDQGNTVWTWTNQLPNPSQNAVFKVRRYERSLWPGDASITAAVGGSLTFNLVCGQSNAGRDYALYGTISGTSPGTVLPGGMLLPLNWDSVSRHTRVNAGMPGLVGFSGQLDSAGNATVTGDTLGPLASSMVGRTFHFAFVLGNPIDFVSNVVAVPVE